jgi:hypothetical protein
VFHCERTHLQAGFEEEDELMWEGEALGVDGQEVIFGNRRSIKAEMQCLK